MLTSALNKGNKPPVIADTIEVVELEMGTQPPELEIRDIGELTMDQFRGIFRLTYAGDAYIVLRTKVQANPLNHKQPDIHLMGGSPGMLAAKQPLVVPMLLRLSHFKLNSYVVLVVSRQKGITLVFKTDPLQNVDINSTFDSIAVIQKFIQREIEGQLRQMFREDLPGIIHRLSQQWVKAKVEAPYLARRTAAPRQQSLETMSNPDLPMYRMPRMPPLGLQPSLLRRSPHSISGHMRVASSSSLSLSSAGRRPTASVISSRTSRTTHTPTPASEGPTTFPELENFDPTYGLRPEGLPPKSVFSSFRSLFSPSKGLADLAEEPSEIDDEATSYDAGNWEELLSDYNGPASASEAGDMSEYESVPAVGGGTITRPRVIHSQSQIQSEVDDVPGTRPRRATLGSRPSSSTSRPSGSRRGSLYNPYFAGATPTYENSVPDLVSNLQTRWGEDFMAASRSSLPPVPALDHSPPRRASSSSSLHTQPSRSSDVTRSIPTPPAPDIETGIQISRPRRLSLTSANLDHFHSGSPDEHYHMPEHDPKIVLRPALNGSISKLSTLSHSNHTLSPYTRTLEHFTVRSVPPREAASSGNVSTAERAPVRARRKRTHRLGGKPARPPDPPRSPSPSPAAASSEFDASEMDRYFCSRDELLPRFPDLPSPHTSTHTRRRSSHQLLHEP
ncbi:hypothetical protein CERSUDRAFT_111008 [Gelatoporia subvermispora B]|uniref:SMP-LTD domain-containing protein n=1 Tax=Ceriporiopsis subvermispora (strain B) TaxID=914234 RepID=M2R7K4_CERS8|nr:hypothetical protein CERSUDRAFT_111008 [Gelatoporia subvermispora B]